MQGRKASVSLEVKRVIAALCRLLVAAGITSVPAADIFRRAKFGDVAAEEPLFKLLLDILQTSSNITPESCKEEIGKLLSTCLGQAGYHANWVHEEEVGRPSSRDLLLALGWLLAMEMPERLMTKRVLKLDTTLQTIPCVNSQINAGVNCDSLRKLNWLVGSLKNQGRILFSMIDEHASILHAVLSASQSSSFQCASSSAHASTLKKDCAVMSDLCELFQAYLEWKSGENGFWTWMDSVVDCHQKDPRFEVQTHAANRNALTRHHGYQEPQLLTTSQDFSEATSVLANKRSGPVLFQTYRARLQAEASTRHSSLTAEASTAVGLQVIPASEIIQSLADLETRLLESRDRQRQRTRTQLQDMMGRLEGLVLIPP